MGVPYLEPAQSEIVILIEDCHLSNMNNKNKAYGTIRPDTTSGVDRRVFQDMNYDQH